MSDYSINILHLYPDLLNLYGDKGNIEALRKRLIWRGINVNLSICTADDNLNFSEADIVVLGGGADRESELVLEKLLPHKNEIADYVEKGGTFLALCSSFPLIGKEITVDKKTIEGLGIIPDIITQTDTKAKRLTGNIMLECTGINAKVIGFENHGSKTHIGKHSPLGKVVKGFGNDGQSGFEGVIYKNLIGTYLHGPLLPKNPELCDLILSNALKNKYEDFSVLSPLDDEMEILANQYMEKRI